MSQALPYRSHSAPLEAGPLIERARELFPLIRDNAAATEAGRRVVDANIDALRAAGLLRVSTPRRYGGAEADLRTTITISGEIARACGSTGWVTALLNMCSWVIGLYPARVQAEIFGADPDARVCAVVAPRATTRRVADGYVVTGKWPWASACLHAQWAAVGIPVVDDAGAVVDQGFALIPMSELAIEDSWFSVGMRGTGSNTLVGTEVFVPDHRVMSLTGAIEGRYLTEHKDEALYRAGFMPVLVMILVGPPLGLARAALDCFGEQMPSRGIIYTSYDRQIDAPVTHEQIAEAAMLIDSAHLHAYRAADDIDSLAAAGSYPDLAARARMRMDCSRAVHYAREAVNLLVSASGGSAFGESNPLQRIWRDINTSSLHGILTHRTNLEMYGRILLGLPQNSPLI